MKTLVISLLAGTAALSMVSATQAADLIVDYAPVSPGVVDVSGDWDGAYVGIFAGYGWGNVDHTSLVPGNDMEAEGYKLGVTAGANFTLSEAIVAGIVGDIAWSNISGYEEFGTGDTTHTIDWQGSVRGRLGFDGGAFLPYVTGGLAVAHATRSFDDSIFGDGDGEASATHIGWTVGAGVEFAVAENASLNLEYRYSDFGEQVYDYDEAPYTNPTIDLTEHLVTVGLNWRF